MGLESHVAVVTGATGGIGRAVAEALAAEGVRLALVARRRDRLEAMAADLHRTFGVEAHAVPGDASTAAVNEDAVSLALRRWQRVDYALGCAGAHEFDAANDPGVVERMLRQNAMTKAMLASAAAAPMRERRSGHLVFLSSMASTTPLAGQSAYCASMAAVDHLARSLALELAPHGVRVHAYAPGLVDTPLARRNFHALALERLGESGAERFWKEDVLRPAEAARDVVAILKNPAGYGDVVVARPPKVVL